MARIINLGCFQLSPWLKATGIKWVNILQLGFIGFIRIFIMDLGFRGLGRTTIIYITSNHIQVPRKKQISINPGAELQWAADTCQHAPRGRTNEQTQFWIAGLGSHNVQLNNVGYL